MPYVSYRLQITGSFLNRGFGFSCMREAYDNNISGTLFYESAESVIIEISGREQDLIRLVENCKKADYIKDIHILKRTRTSKKADDFIMLNQID